MAGGTPCRGVEQRAGGGGAGQGGPERAAIAVYWRPLRVLRLGPRAGVRRPWPRWVCCLCAARRVKAFGEALELSSRGSPCARYSHI